MKQPTTSLKKWGNSKGLRLPKEVIEALGLELDMEFAISMNIETKELLLTPVVTSLTPYQQIIKNNRQAKKEAIPFRWDRIEDSEELI